MRTNGAKVVAPPRRLAIGCDGSEGARDALALARVLAGRDASFLLVDVAPRGILGRRLSDHRPADFSAARASLAGADGAAEVETRTVRAESAAEVLADIGGDERRDLIVVGSPHRGALGRALLGSVAKSLLHRSPVPVAVAPRGFHQGEPPARLVVGFDGSAESRAALDWAADFATGRGAEIEVYTVATPPVSIPGALGYRPPGPDDPFTPLEQATDRIDEEVAVHAHLRVGPAAPNLAAAARPTDLLVVGVETRGGLEEALIGSVTDALVTSPGSPIVVVPRP